METAIEGLKQLASASRGLLQRFLIIGENRLELLTVEVQEERDRLLHAMLLAFAVAAFGLLAGMTLTVAIVVMLWAYSPLAVLLVLTALYCAAGACLYGQFSRQLRHWQALPATLDQFRKDRECLEKILG
jgi:uncharacterized membrane protein YqjE